MHELRRILERQFRELSSGILGLRTCACHGRRSSGRCFRLQLHTTDIVRRAFEISGAFTGVGHMATREEALRREKK